MRLDVILMGFMLGTAVCNAGQGDTAGVIRGLLGAAGFLVFYLPSISAQRWKPNDGQAISGRVARAEYMRRQRFDWLSQFFRTKRTKLAKKKSRAAAEPKRYRYDLIVPELGGAMHGFTTAFTHSHVRAYIKKLYGMKSSVPYVQSISEV